MAKYAINPTGLRVKPTYESQLNYIANQPTIAYPDRGATFAARSIKMNQLFNESASQMAEQQARIQTAKYIKPTKVWNGYGRTWARDGSISWTSTTTTIPCRKFTASTAISA